MDPENKENNISEWRKKSRESKKKEIKESQPFFYWSKFLLVVGFGGGAIYFSERHSSVDVNDLVMIAFLIIGAGIGFGFMHHLSD